MADLVTYASDEAMDIHVVGAAPNGFLAYRFGDGMDMRTLFDPGGFSDVKVKATQGAAGGAGAVVVKQLRR
jgi:hypothetical protein